MLKQTAQVWRKTDQAATWSSQAYIQWLQISVAQVRHKTWHQKQKIFSIQVEWFKNILQTTYLT